MAAAKGCFGVMPRSGLVVIVSPRAGMRIADQQIQPPFPFTWTRFVLDVGLRKSRGTGLAVSKRRGRRIVFPRQDSPRPAAGKVESPFQVYTQLTHPIHNCYRLSFVVNTRCPTNWQPIRQRYGHHCRVHAATEQDASFRDGEAYAQSVSGTGFLVGGRLAQR